jgi:hypothetical protein
LDTQLVEFARLALSRIIHDGKLQRLVRSGGQAAYIKSQNAFEIGSAFRRSIRIERTRDLVAARAVSDRYATNPLRKLH